LSRRILSRERVFFVFATHDKDRLSSAPSLNIIDSRAFFDNIHPQISNAPNGFAMRGGPERWGRFLL